MSQKLNPPNTSLFGKPTDPIGKPADPKGKKTTKSTKFKSTKNKSTNYYTNGMQGKLKTFDKKLSDTFDTRARAIIKEKLGDSVADNPNIYGEDMVVLNKKIPFEYIELQVYGKWNNDKFPHPSPYI